MPILSDFSRCSGVQKHCNLAIASCLITVKCHESLNLDPKLQQQKQRLEDLLKAIERLAAETESGSIVQTVQDLRENINQPFLFVVIGEVKAGKSSFINSLLGAEICEVGADPRTAVVSKIVHAEQPYIRELKPNQLNEVGRPEEILRSLAVVDTPGTNSPFLQHEAVTRSFIPNSDLVLFVFFAKNPYTNTAWQLLDYAAKEWNKPVAFILQQADVTTPLELETAYQYIEQEAQQSQISQPQVFPCSAKLEQAGEIHKSGFETVREFIQDTVTGTHSYGLKLKSSLRSAQTLLTQLERSIHALQQQLEVDQAAVENIRQRLSQGQQQSRYEIDSLVTRLVAQYDRIIQQIRTEFKQGLSVFALARRSLLSVFNRQQRVETWITQLKQKCQCDLEAALEQTSQEGASHFLKGVQQLINQLVSDLDATQQQQMKNANVSMPLLVERYEVIESVRARISHLLEDSRFAVSVAEQADGVGVGIASGGLLAVIGGIIAAVTEIVILDIVGSLFMGVGVLFAGGVLLAKRNAIVQKFERELKKKSRSVCRGDR
ncbi:MAG: hypothetical protein HC886_03935 [Leptolyngbyaceae cyanobacterium SM1_1_3]|nr:hypothetical protein [Leptolyngbyaceae cyanobacterium SM1_1_3]